MEQEKLLERLAQNREFTDKLAEAGSLEETVKLFAAEGVNITAKDLEKAAELASAEGELDETMLDNVAGGGFLKYLNPFYWLGRAIGSSGC